MKQSNTDPSYSYKPAHLVEAESRWYVEFFVWDVQKSDLVRKRITSIEGKTPREKREYGKKLAADLNNLLSEGYVIDRSKEQPQGSVPEQETVKKYTFLEAIQYAVSVKINSGGVRTKENYSSFENIITDLSRFIN